MSQSDWKPVRVYGHGLQAHLGRTWNCEPAWDVYALYPRPDGELSHPDARRAKLDPRGSYPNRDKKRYVFWNRHIDRRYHINYPHASENSPRTVSKTIGDARREWAIMAEHRDRYLKDAGLSLTSPPEAIAKCLADTFKWDTYFKNKPPCHTFNSQPRSLTNPIEGLLHQSFCVGCAHAYAVLAEVSGLVTRTIGCGAHRVAEVLVNGHWRMIENSCRHEGCRGLEAFFPAGFMEVTLEPDAFHECIPDRHLDGYWNMPSGQYHFTGGTWQSPMTLRMACSNAFALYPELTRWGIKSHDGKRLPMLLRRNGFYWEDSRHASDDAALLALRRRVCSFPIEGNEPVADFLYYPFGPGERLRQSIWLDALDDLECLELTIPFAPEPHIDFSNALGRQLVVKVGDFEATLACLGGWPPAPADNRGHRHSTVRIPREALLPRCVNWIELHQNSTATLQAPFLPSAMQPYFPPLLHNPTASVMNTPNHETTA